jgi:hypothetical protein
MSTKNPFFVSPPTDFQQFGSGKFLINYSGSNIKISLNGGLAWQTLPPSVNIPKGTPESTVDETANDISKIFTVPTGEIWTINNIKVKHIATATVGTRVIFLYVRNSSNEYLYNTYTAGITASEIHNIFFSSIFNTIAEVQPGIQTLPFPKLYLQGGDYIEIQEAANIDSNDNMYVYTNKNVIKTLESKEITINASDLLISWTKSIVHDNEQSIHVLKLD